MKKISRLATYVTTLKKDLENFIRGKKVAVWGASLQSLTVLAVTGIRGIRCVVDSSPEKQNRFTPVSHIPIVSPKALREDSVEAVIIMAPRYEKEILRQLKTQEKFSGTIAILNGSKLKILK